LDVLAFFVTLFSTWAGRLADIASQQRKSFGTKLIFFPLCVCFVSYTQHFAQNKYSTYQTHLNCHTSIVSSWHFAVAAKLHVVCAVLIIILSCHGTAWNLSKRVALK
jgi:hypothetical protein